MINFAALPLISDQDSQHLVPKALETKEGMFHVIFNPPQEAGICDLCGSELYQRKDDNAEVIEKRLSSYEKETGAPLTEFYTNYPAGKFIKINAELSPDKVYSAINAEIGVWQQPHVV